MIILEVAPTVFEENLIEILLGLVLLFNITAWKIFWEKMHDVEDEVSKNSKSVTMILNSIFGLEEDSTDEGHLVETSEKFNEIEGKIDRLAEEQKKSTEQRKKEHENVSNTIEQMVELLSENDDIKFDKRNIKR